MFDQLLLAYERGLLVPFTGAGMSAPACRLWRSFIEELETQAGVETPDSEMDLTARGARAVRRLRLDSDKNFELSTAAALSHGPQNPPDQTLALAQIHWPPVVTTNY